MLKFLVLALVITAVCAEEAKVADTAQVDSAKAEPAQVESELNPAESAIPVMVDHDDRNRQFHDGLQLNRYREQRVKAQRYRSMHDNHDHDEYDHDDYRSSHHHDHVIPGPVILRSINPHSHRHPDIERQNKIIADVYSPDYYQPTWVLDYRYLKTGGRDYTRGPGGQILILPKNVRSKEPKDFPDFDSLLEHLRLSRLSEQSQHRRGHGHHDAFHGYRTMDHGHQEHKGHQNWWNPYRH